METESSVSKSVEEKPPNTSDVSAQDAEAMANAMLLDSPCQIPKGAMRRSQRMADATSFRRREKA